MKIKVLPVGPLMENCYMAYDEKSLEGILVDPGADEDIILQEVKKLNLKIKYIVNTHGHADHIGGNEGIVKDLNCDLLIHEDDLPMLGDPNLNLSVTGYMGRPIISPAATKIVQEGDIISFGDVQLKVIHTPGHTPGGICLYGDGVLFSGDSLFAGSIGRTDFPGGSLDSLIANLKEKILILPEDTKVYPGHGGASTIGFEKISNPYLV